MSVLLVVVSASTSPLSTDVPIPTDGQPEQADCPGHGRVVIDYGDDGHIADDGPDTGMGHAPGCAGECRYCPVPVQIDPRYPCGPLVPDGPFPFTVAVCSEWKQCRYCGEERGVPAGECAAAGTSCWMDAFRAVVGLVGVIGPSHQGGPDCALQPCGRGDIDGWHTPTGTFTRIDPIPCDRPRHTSGHLTGFASRPPASVWVADDDLAARIRAAGGAS